MIEENKTIHPRINLKIEDLNYLLDKICEKEKTANYNAIKNGEWKVAYEGRDWPLVELQHEVNLTLTDEIQDKDILKCLATIHFDKRGDKITSFRLGLNGEIIFEISSEDAHLLLTNKTRVELKEKLREELTDTINKNKKPKI